jgi:DNA-directed RNA polymerase specialized sigma24 family protein
MRRTLSHVKKIAARYRQLPIDEERKLISLAKSGNRSAHQRIALHLTGFFVFRIETTLFSCVIEQHGEDILQECFLFLASKIGTFKLRYRDRFGRFKKVRLSTYLWKGITGVMLSYIRRMDRKSSIAFREEQEFLVEDSA